MPLAPSMVYSSPTSTGGSSLQLLPAVGSALPVTQGLQPIASDILGEKPIERPPCVPRKLRDSSEAKDWLILKKGLTNE